MPTRIPALLFWGGGGIPLLAGGLPSRPTGPCGPKSEVRKVEWPRSLVRVDLSGLQAGQACHSRIVQAPLRAFV